MRFCVLACVPMFLTSIEVYDRQTIAIGLQVRLDCFEHDHIYMSMVWIMVYAPATLVYLMYVHIDCMICGCLLQTFPMQHLGFMWCNIFTSAMKTWRYCRSSTVLLCLIV